MKHDANNNYKHALWFKRVLSGRLAVATELLLLSLPMPVKDFTVQLGNKVPRGNPTGLRIVRARGRQLLWEQPADNNQSRIVK